MMKFVPYCLFLLHFTFFAELIAAAELPPVDFYGDALPEGAVARMGSIKLRHAGLSDFRVLSDGKTIVTSGNDRIERFWDIATGRQLRAVKLQGTGDCSRGIDLSRDGKLLAGYDGAKLTFWDVETGKELKTLPGPGGDVGFLWFSPDNNKLAVGKIGDRGVTLCDWKNAKESHLALSQPAPNPQFGGADSTFHGGFSPDGKLFVFGIHWDQPLVVFDLASGRELHSWNCYASVSAFSPDSKRLAVSSMQNDNGERRTLIRIFDMESGKETAQFPMGDQGSFFSLAFSPDGKMLACCFSDRSCLLDCTNGKVLHRLSGRPITVAFTPDGKFLVASTGHLLRLWDVATGKELQDRPGEFGYTPVLAVSPDGQLLASGDWMEQSVTIWDSASGRLAQSLPLKGKERYVRSLAFSADGQTLVACQGMGFLQFWNTASGKELRSIQLLDPARPNSQELYLYQLRVSPDVKYVSTLDMTYEIGAKPRLALWDTISGKLQQQSSFPTLGGQARAGAWSDEGKLLALGAQDQLIVMGPNQEVLQLTISGTWNGGPLEASPDGRLLAARRKDGVGIWESASATEIVRLKVEGIDHLALVPGNRFLVTADRESLHVWDLATGDERMHRQLSMPVLRMILSPDGKRAFTAMSDGTALVWDLSSALTAKGKLAKESGEKEIADWWDDLKSDAYDAIWRLEEAPPDLVTSFLCTNLKPPDAGKGNSAEVIRRRRAIQVLERIASEDAKKLLTELARGPADAQETHAAKASLRRLSQKP
ncbi:MAG TPA: WD40 repeat domain-containing protein [Gemmataceae bacterium]|nr:WD40 repeat domain-containing protein [Gemmataceae bacterium]